MERRYGEASTVFCTQYSQRDCPQHLSAGVHTARRQDYGPPHRQHEVLLGANPQRRGDRMVGAAQICPWTELASKKLAQS